MFIMLNTQTSLQTGNLPTVLHSNWDIAFVPHHLIRTKYSTVLEAQRREIILLCV